MEAIMYMEHTNTKSTTGLDKEDTSNNTMTHVHAVGIESIRLNHVPHITCPMYICLLYVNMHNI